MDVEVELDMLNPDEEKREISVQLALIRKKHDQAKEANLKKRNEVAKLK
jgi:predicted  nucleic acid-binding Zn-ribbon protein